VGRSCSYFGEQMPENVVMFNNSQEALQTIDEIVASTGLRRNFVVSAAGVPNAAAIINGAERHILYNPRFMTDVRQQAGNPWAPKSIMAHEIGHHLQGHTLQSGGSRPEIELEADFYSGFVLQRLGASLADAQVAMEHFASEQASQTHPAKRDRLAAIASGWEQSCDRDPSCRAGSTETEPPSVDPTPASSPNSCEYANDDECDEPDLCDPGTDTNDCRPSGRSTANGDPSPVAAQMCYTNWGSCPMMVSIPVGSVCNCNGIYPGIAR
jgi:hypothetical protein